ncbi:MAG: T9SS type A sorting domain-containing protein, partial [Bacteroidetes bacterium]|nr:T9SS type A sorting domain-containing protein [Bacteroidota bacterium]
QSITSSQSGTYYAVVTNADGCSDTTATYTTTLFADPINTVTASKTTLCVNDSALLSAYAGYSYLWNTNDTTQSITVHTSGNYFVSLTSSDGCSAISDTVIISVVPDATEIFGNDLVQPNSAQVYATQQNPGNTYSWVVTGGALVSGQNTNAISVLWGAAGNGQISVQENSGLCTYSDTLEVTISGIGVGESVLPESLIYPNPSNGLFTLEVAESLIGSEYELTDGLGRLIEKGKIESTSQDFDLLSKPKGVYRLSIKSTNGIKTMAVVVQ